MRGPASEEEGAAEATWRTGRSSIPDPSTALCGEEVEKVESAVQPGEKGPKRGRGYFKIWLYFSLSYSDVIGNKLGIYTSVIENKTVTR